MEGSSCGPTIYRNLPQSTLKLPQSTAIYRNLPWNYPDLPQSTATYTETTAIYTETTTIYTLSVSFGSTSAYQLRSAHSEMLVHRRDLHCVSKRNRFALENTEAVDLKIAISTINKVEADSL